MWCIAALTEEYRQRMYHLLALYARPLRSDEPVVCIDEKSLQLLAHSRTPMPMKPGRLRKEDYEYVRRGTCNLFVAVEPKAGKRNVVVTDRRGKSDFVAFVQHLLEGDLQNGPSPALGAGQSEHPLREELHRRPRIETGRQAAAPGAVSRHAKARKLVEHGGDRNRSPHEAVPEHQSRRT